ncbi:MAG: hypothetical protein RhofKO_14460 [Rhodothermales bacterium]
MLPRLLYAFLMLCVLIPASGSAQNSLTRLRLVHQSTPLPEGTAFVVLQKMSAEKVGNNWQPEFLEAADFPVTSIEPIQFDTLAADLESQQSYLRTSATGHLYFFYALTLEDQLYWSYSYQRSQPKFDALELGAMSVAPLADASISDVIRARFFMDEPLEAPPADTLAATLSALAEPNIPEATDPAPPVSLPSNLVVSDGSTPWWLWLAWALVVLTTAGLFYQQHRIRALTNELQRVQAAAPLPPVAPSPPASLPTPTAAPSTTSTPPTPKPAPPAPSPLDSAPELAASKAAVDQADATLKSTSRSLHDQETFAKTMRTEALSDFETLRRNLEAIDQIADDLKRPPKPSDQS